MMAKLGIAVYLLAILNLGFARVLKDNFDERGSYYQGDIKLKPGTLESIKAGLIGDEYRWLNKHIIYQLSPEFTGPELNIIHGAMEEIRQKTCIEFVQRSNEEDYVLVTREITGCWSYVGRQGTGPQELNLQPAVPGCISHGIIAHEFIHAIGFFHEHSRTDRDDYIEIIWGNIPEELHQNFAKYPESLVDDFGVAYDFDSVMHASEYTFAVNPKFPTIITKPPGIPIGQRLRLSEKDAEQINRMYCPERLNKIST